MNTTVNATPFQNTKFLRALLWNTLWVNISGLPRYFLLIAPMLHAAFPNNPEIAPVSLPIMASWGLWTIVFLLASTGFYWMYLELRGNTKANVVTGALWLTSATIGLTWLGIVNMGMVSVKFLYVAMAWATVEQLVSAFIVSKAKGH